ncbi:hypothetical protein [Pontibacter ummariensis]|nr:hypothetical protein [Pontibacter ummariensis]
MKKKRIYTKNKDVELLEDQKDRSEENNAYYTYMNFNYGKVSERYYSSEEAQGETAAHPGQGERKSLLN